MKWAKYDGTEATLPPVSSRVVVKKRHSLEFLAVYIGGAWATLSDGFVPLSLGDSWLPIPTEVECAAWERLREAAKRMSDTLGDHRSTWDAAAFKAAREQTEALEALDALLKKPGGQ